MRGTSESLRKMHKIQILRSDFSVCSSPHPIFPSVPLSSCCTLPLLSPEHSGSRNFSLAFSHSLSLISPLSPSLLGLIDLVLFSFLYNVLCKHSIQTSFLTSLLPPSPRYKNSWEASFESLPSYFWPLKSTALPVISPTGLGFFLIQLSCLLWDFATSLTPSRPPLPHLLLSLDWLSALCLQSPGDPLSLVSSWTWTRTVRQLL